VDLAEDLVILPIVAHLDPNWLADGVLGDHHGPGLIRLGPAMLEVNPPGFAHTDMECPEAAFAGVRILLRQQLEDRRVKRFDRRVGRLPFDPLPGFFDLVIFDRLDPAGFDIIRTADALFSGVSSILLMMLFRGWAVELLVRQFAVTGLVEIFEALIQVCYFGVLHSCPVFFLTEKSVLFVSIRRKALSRSTLGLVIVGHPNGSFPHRSMFR
jgi:hypothetical protein